MAKLLSITIEGKKYYNPLEREFVTESLKLSEEDKAKSAMLIASKCCSPTNNIEKVEFVIYNGYRVGYDGWKSIAKCYEVILAQKIVIAREIDDESCDFKEIKVDSEEKYRYLMLAQAFVEKGLKGMKSIEEYFK